MLPWLRYLLLGIAFARSVSAQGENENEPDENEPDENEPDENEPDENEGGASSTSPPATTTVPATASVATPTSAPVTTSVAPETSLITATIDGTPTTSSTFITSPTSTLPTESQTTGSDTASSSNSPENGSGGLSTGAKAGIGVGVAVFVLLFFGFLFEWYRRRMKRSRDEHKERYGDSMQRDSKRPQRSLGRFRRTLIDDHYAAESKPNGPHGQPEVYAHYSEKGNGSEMMGVPRATTERHELDAAVPTYELEGERENKTWAAQSPTGQTVISPISPLENVSTFHR